MLMGPPLRIHVLGERFTSTGRDIIRVLGAYNGIYWSYGVVVLVFIFGTKKSGQVVGRGRPVTGSSPSTTYSVRAERAERAWSMEHGASEYWL